MERKLSYKDYMAMSPGQKEVFEFDTVPTMISAKAIGYQMPKNHPREDVSRYSIIPDWDKKTLTVTAIPAGDDAERN